MNVLYADPRHDPPNPPTVKSTEKWEFYQLIDLGYKHATTGSGTWVHAGFTKF